MTAINETFGRKAPADERLDFADMRRRIKAIFIGSIGNLVEWYDFFAYAAFALYFAARVLPERRSRGATAQRRAAVRGRLPGAAARRLAVRPSRRPLRRRNALMLSVLLMCFGSLMIAVTPTYATIGIARADRARLRAHHPGAEPRRRIRHQRHLPHRDGRRAQPRVLFELPVRHPDRRPAVRARRAAAAAEGLPHQRGDPGLGLAHSVRHRRRARRHRTGDAAQPRTRPTPSRRRRRPASGSPRSAL